MTKHSYPREQLYSIPNLRSRGWTDAAIRDHLPEAADDTRPNPRYKSGQPMRLWLVERVHRVEQTDEFRAWQLSSAARKDRSRRAVHTRTVNMCHAAQEAKIEIITGKKADDVYDLALQTHGGNYQGEPGPFYWSPRKARNCIRHNLTNYEDLWALCNRGDTGQGAYEILRRRVDDAISRAYPWLVEWEHREYRDTSPEVTP